MTQEEVIKLAAEAGFKWPDICETTIEQRLERFANLVVAAEREKCTNTQEFVTLPREVIEQTMKAMEDAGMQRGGTSAEVNAIEALRAALEQPQNHVPDAGNMVPAGWKLVPVEPTQEQLNALHVGLTNGWRSAYCAMLDAAPKPPTVKDSLTVEQPQADQPAMTPIAQRKLDDLVASGYTISGYSVYHEQKHQHGFVTGAGLVGWWKPEGMEYPQPLGEQDWQASAAYDMIDRYLRNNLHDDDYSEYSAALDSIYTNLQPKREPLTDEEIDKLCPQFDDPMRREMWIIGFKAAHNIK